jgi:hypothetical protein
VNYTHAQCYHPASFEKVKLMAQLSIPQGTDALTAEWLTAALAGTTATGTRVAAFQATRIAEGVGFLGELARVKLTYDGDPGTTAPRSVVVKLPVQVPAARAMAQGLQLYEREVGFYRHAAASAGVRVPLCYHAAFAADGDFALVLEDVQARPGDQLASCTTEQARMVIRALAKLHSHWWNSPRLSTSSWLPSRGHPYFEVARASYLQAVPLFVERWSHHFDPKVIRTCQRFGEYFHQYREAGYQRPTTLSHSDFRLDNVLFGEPGTADEVVIIDWQACQHASGANDLHYFISGNFPAAVGVAQTQEWLRFYHEELRAGGVHDYSMSDLEEDFARASAFFCAALVFGTVAINPDQQDERGRLLVNQLFGSLADSMLRYDAERFLVD